MGLFNKKKKVETGDSVTANQFQHNGKKYNVLRGAKVRLASGSFDLLTAADICVHPEAQAFLVENGCSNIEEVIE